jgi:hypothetical protein
LNNEGTAHMLSIDLRSNSWVNLHNISNRRFNCGFCGIHVSSTIGAALNGPPHNQAVGGIYICPNCGCPTFLGPSGFQNPSPALGKSVEHVPDELNTLYEEARRSTSQNCYTGAVLLCRKILMHIAVEVGATEGLSFIEYVKYLSDQSYVPPNGKQWVDHIRKKGNEANHEITLMNQVDANELLIFIEMLLKFIYEFPNMIPTSP